MTELANSSLLRSADSAGGTALGALAVALIGLAIEPTLIRRFYRRPEEYQLLITFGLLLVLEDVIRLIWGGTPRTVGGLVDYLGLVRIARRESDVVVVSIFVNPLQFGSGEDLDRYPRDEAHDLELCETEGVDVVFLPSVDEMYPEGRSTSVSAGPIGSILEGAARPGHFDGVCTVVAKLFNLVEPDVAVFGQKDAQQVAVIKRMVADLSYRLRLVIGPTAREPDGLALSSRNVHLSTEDRRAALALFRALSVGREAIAAQEGPEIAEKKMWEVLTSTDGVEPDYARAVDPETFDEPQARGPGLLIVAARVGGVRLIDNVLLDPVAPSGHIS